MNDYPQPPQNQSSVLGLIVLALAEAQRLEPGEVRDLALCSLIEYGSSATSGSSATQLYLVAKALNESTPALKLLPGEINIQDVVEECQRLLSDYYPEFRQSPRVQQMLETFSLLNKNEEEIKQARDISAADVFGVQANVPGVPDSQETP